MCNFFKRDDWPARGTSWYFIGIHQQHSRFLHAGSLISSSQSRKLVVLLACSMKVIQTLCGTLSVVMNQGFTVLTLRVDSIIGFKLDTLLFLYLKKATITCGVVQLLSSGMHCNVFHKCFRLYATVIQERYLWNNPPAHRSRKVVD